MDINIFLKYPTAQNYNIANEAKRAYSNKLHMANVNHEKKITSNMKSNPKQFFSYLNSKKEIKNDFSVLIDEEGNTLENPVNIANEFGRFFESTFTSEPAGEIPDIKHGNANSKVISDLIISATDVKKLLKNLNIYKSLGPDGIHPKLLKSLSENEAFVDTVTALFQSCYDTGVLPKAWKTAEVKALYKKGDKMHSKNYRPISLTCILSKLFEKLMRNHILDHVYEYICTEQHGFLPKRSCLSNLLDCIHHAYEILEENESIDIFYLDFMKAFDTVPHKRLLKKLKAYGIVGKTYAVIEDFLKNREFKVKVGASYSRGFKVASGIPQGSVLGPLLFLIYINDLPLGLASYVLLFADDLKMIAKASDYTLTQKDLEELSRWQNLWLLRFNTADNKCKILHVGKNNPAHSYTLDNTLLPSTECEKDLGVYVTKNLNWASNIDELVSKANRMIGWVSRSVITREPTVMLNIYKSLVRPHLEYCTQLWNLEAKHGNWMHIMRIEDVQRKYTRMIDGIGLLTYEERLTFLGLTTLLERRMRGDIIETFRIYKGLTRYGQRYLNLSRSGYNIVTTSKSGSFLTNRVANYWNKYRTGLKMQRVFLPSK